jgi:hypothetical protein
MCKIIPIAFLVENFILIKVAYIEYVFMEFFESHFRTIGYVLP